MIYRGNDMNEFELMNKILLLENNFGGKVTLERENNYKVNAMMEQTAFFQEEGLNEYINWMSKVHRVCRGEAKPLTIIIQKSFFYFEEELECVELALEKAEKKKLESEQKLEFILKMKERQDYAGAVSQMMCKAKEEQNINDYNDSIIHLKNTITKWKNRTTIKGEINGKKY